MDRFFSKLDLRDIKIKPEGSRFLPDEDDVETADEQANELHAFDDRIDMTAETVSPDVIPSAANGHVVAATYERVTVTEWQTSTETTTSPRFVGADDSVDDAEVLKVSAKSRPSAVAGAIAGVVRENGRAEVQAIGAGATNQAVKAIAIAREYLLESEIDAVCVPAFIDVTIDNEERTAIRLIIEKR